MSTDRHLNIHRQSVSSWGLVFPLLILLSILVVIVPLPPAILDVLLAANITLSMVILLTTVFVASPLDFSAFPSLLLLATMARLVLNIASTRLILTRAATDETHAAGEVIQAFAQFVAQGQLIVGLILFAIVVVVQFVVVTKGATRLSEVAARFALDGMPGKQLAIDADLNSGRITADEARSQRLEVTAQADFHSAMDGAGKFVRGDAVAGIFITLINIIGGLSIGIFQHGMKPSRAVEVFTVLAIGDGLVTLLPSFLIALAAALLATRSSTKASLSDDLIGQTLREPAALYLASAALFALAFTGLPMLPLVVLGAGCAMVGKNLGTRRHQADHQHLQQVAAAAEQRSIKSPLRPEDHLFVEPIELELGIRLIRLANPEVGGDLMERIAGLRHRIAQELGIILPKVKVRDSMRVSERTYQIRLRGVTVASGEIRPDELLAIDTGLVSGELAGIEIHEPASQRPAKWIEPARINRAKELGYRIVEPINVLIAHLTEVVRSHADELLTRQQVHQLLDNLRQSAPRVVDELIPELLKPSQVHQVLANLLRERVPIRDLETILETLGEHANHTRDTAILTELVRQAMSRTICQPYRDQNDVVAAMTLDPALEELLLKGIQNSEPQSRISLSPQTTEGLVRELARQTKKILRAGHSPVVVCGQKLRPVLRRISEGSLPKLAVLSLQEIPRDIRLQSLVQIPLNAIKALPQPRRSVSHAEGTHVFVERLATLSPSFTVPH